MLRPTRKFIWLALVCLLSPGILLGQDANPWTQQYGAYATLLGGAVIGSSSGLAATYYNPGRLVLSDSELVVISAKAYQLTTLRIENATGFGGEVKNDQIGGSPDLVAGYLPSKNLCDDCRIAYSILHRYDGSFNLTTRAGTTDDILPDIPNEDFLAGELSYDYKVSDFWVGFTYSQKFKENIGIGVSQFFSIRTQNWDRRIFYETLLQDDRTATASQFQNFNYLKVSLVWRFGISGDFDDGTTWGASLTTPYVNLFGKGYVLYNELISGGDLDQDGMSDDLLSANQQGKRPARFRNSWAFGAGASRMFGEKLRVHISGEFFAKVKSFNLVDAEPFESQSNGDTLSHFVSYAQDAIFNFGLGAEYSANQKMDYYASFSTDFSPAPEGENAGINAYLSTNLYHLAGGTAITLGKVDLNLGLVYSFGNDVIPSLSSIYLPAGWNIRDAGQSGNMHWRRIKLIFGISVN